MLPVFLLFLVAGSAGVVVLGSLQVASSTSAWSSITRLLGFDGPLPFALETGYVEVDSEFGVRLFSYFVPSQRRPETDPLLIWLTGGPGCSALTGLMYEIGPLSFDFDGYKGGFPTLISRQGSWTKVSSIIFVDCPVGTGFSYSVVQNDHKSNEFIEAHQVFVFLTKWLGDHPQFRSNPLYVAGDSYSGMIVPLVALEIIKSNEAGVLPFLSLKGYIVGNPVTNIKLENAAAVDFRHGMALIPDELYKTLQKACNGDYVSSTNDVCIKSISTMDQLMKDIQSSNVLEPNCQEKYALGIWLDTNYRREILAYHAADHSFLKADIPFGCRDYGYDLVHIWANDDHVREVIGIQKGTVSSWVRCNRHNLPYEKIIEDAASYHLKVLSKGYRALIYSGDHDSIVPFMSTQDWIRSFNFSIIDEWRPWYVDGYVAGFTRAYSNNITYATIIGAGHTAPEYKPKECYVMFERWMASSPL